MALLAAPCVLAWGADVLNRKVVLPKLGTPQPTPFLTLAYGYLPLVWAATLAHYEEPLMAEGGRVVQVRVRLLLLLLLRVGRGSGEGGRRWSPGLGSRENPTKTLAFPHHSPS